LKLRIFTGGRIFNSAFSTNGEKSNAYRLLVGKAEGNSQLGKTRSRWKNNIEIWL
jgi:hypothetical protein